MSQTSQGQMCRWPHFCVVLFTRYSFYYNTYQSVRYLSRWWSGCEVETGELERGAAWLRRAEIKMRACVRARLQMLSRTHRVWVGTFMGEDFAASSVYMTSPRTKHTALALQMLPPPVDGVCARLHSVSVTGDQLVCACIKLSPRIVRFASRSSQLSAD